MTFAPAAMHIPDGFLSGTVAIVLWIAAVGGVAIALRQSRRQLGEQLVPIMGVLGAFIFAAQTLNFPVAGGTSGHLIGATLAAIVLGPWPAVLVLTSVVSIQALLFQDGGLVALGANLLNMAILAPLIGAVVYRWLGRRLGDSLPGKLAVVFFAAWISVVLPAVATSLELAASGTAPAVIVLPMMTWLHMLIGLGEGLITVGAVTFLSTVRPDLLHRGKENEGFAPAMIIAAGLFLAIVAALLSPIASPDPDGLARVARNLGFLTNAQQPVFRILGGYLLPFVSNPALSTILAVTLGAAIVLLLAFLVGRFATRRLVPKEPDGSGKQD
jgi:cobalt/nickel transport system permease protein